MEPYIAATATSCARPSATSLASVAAASLAAGGGGGGGASRRAARGNVVVCRRRGARAHGVRGAARCRGKASCLALLRSGVRRSGCDAAQRGAAARMAPRSSIRRRTRVALAPRLGLKKQGVRSRRGRGAPLPRASHALRFLPGRLPGRIASRAAAAVGAPARRPVVSPQAAAAMAPGTLPQPVPLSAVFADCNRLLAKGDAHLDATRREAERRRADAEAAWAASDDVASAAAGAAFALLSRTAARLHLRQSATAATTAQAVRSAAAVAAHAAAEAGLSAAPRCAFLHVLLARSLERRVSYGYEAWDEVERTCGRDSAEEVDAQKRLQQVCAELREATSEAMRDPPLRLPAPLLDDERRDVELHNAINTNKGVKKPFPLWELHHQCAP